MTATGSAKSPTQRVQHWLIYALARIVGAIVSSMPVDFASAFMGQLWRWIAPLTARQKRVMAHLASAYPDMTDAERRALSLRMWSNIGRTAAESFHIKQLISEPDRVMIAHPEIATDPAKTGEGVILVSLHCGNWELTGPLASREGLPIVAVYQPLKNPLVERYLLSLRAPFITGGLIPKGHKMAREFLRLVRQKKPVAMVADQRDLRGVDVTFFGQLATATPFPAMLARASNTPIVVGMVRRLPGPRVNFDFPLARVDVQKTDDQAADIAKAVQDIHDIFEDWIRQTPDQYMWAHQKWRQSDLVTRRGWSTKEEN